jgi:hypothetical protein
MRPPPQRNFVGVAEQLRPHCGAPRGPRPAPLRNYAAPLNRDDMLTQACQRRYEQNALPLREVNYRRSVGLGDYSRAPPAPKLARRPNVQAPILVRTYE